MFLAPRHSLLRRNRSFGGTDGQYHYNDTWCYDTNTSTWTELSCIGYIPVPREGHAATLVDDVMYILGGRGVDGQDLEDLAAFKISSELFEPLIGSRA
jgi:Galactose oxidase, central domain